MCDVSSCSVVVMKWLVRPTGRTVLRRNGLIVEFWQQLALWVALCVEIAGVLFFGVEHFVPSTVERILRGLKPLLLLLQAPHGGDKPLVEVISFHVCFRDDECIVIRTVFLSWGGLMNLSLGIIVIGCLLQTVFGVT